LELRQYQIEIVNKARALMISGERRILIVSPTGSGKTVLVAHMLKTSMSKGHTSWFTVHRRELIKQSIRTFHQVGVKHGIVSAGFEAHYRSKIQLCAIKSLKNRFHRLARPKFIVIDEGHHTVAGSWKKLYDEYPDSYFILVTATPERLDGKGLRGYANKMINGPTVRWLIDNGYLCDYKAYAPSTISVDGIQKRMGDFSKGALAIAANKPTITGNAINEYKKRCNGKRAVVFCASVEHSKSVVNAFNSNGIKAEHVDGESDSSYRDAAIRRFTDGITKVLSNVDLFGEGFDLPAMEGVILLRPTHSLALHLQQIGRVLRPSPGEEFAVILDHAGNLERHGLPDEERQWNLDGKKAREKAEQGNEIKVRTCPACFAVQLIFRTTCKYCGVSLVAKNSRQIEEVDGELEEINLEKLRQRRQVMRQQGRSTSLEQLYELGKSRGYKRPRAWAKHVFNARQAKKIRGVN